MSNITQHIRIVSAAWRKVDASIILRSSKNLLDFLGGKEFDFTPVCYTVKIFKMQIEALTLEKKYFTKNQVRVIKHRVRFIKFLQRVIPKLIDSIPHLSLNENRFVSEKLIPEYKELLSNQKMKLNKDKQELFKDTSYNWKLWWLKNVVRKITPEAFNTAWIYKVLNNEVWDSSGKISEAVVDIDVETAYKSNELDVAIYHVRPESNPPSFGRKLRHEDLESAMDTAVYLSNNVPVKWEVFNYKSGEILDVRLHSTTPSHRYRGAIQKTGNNVTITERNDAMRGDCFTLVAQKVDTSKPLTFNGVKILDPNTLIDPESVYSITILALVDSPKTVADWTIVDGLTIG